MVECCSSSADSLLVKRCYNILTSKYVNEKGKKFIFHLISAFLPKEDKAKLLTDEDIPESGVTCCLGGCELVSESTQINLTPRKVIVDNKLKLYPRVYHYGYKSNSSDKAISEEGLEALTQFVDYRASIGDKAISRMYSHVRPSKSKLAVSSSLNKASKAAGDIQAIPVKG